MGRQRSLEQPGFPGAKRDDLRSDRDRAEPCHPEADLGEGAVCKPAPYQYPEYDRAIPGILELAGIPRQEWGVLGPDTAKLLFYRIVGSFGNKGLSSLCYFEPRIQ